MSSNPSITLNMTLGTILKRHGMKAVPLRKSAKRKNQWKKRFKSRSAMLKFMAKIRAKAMKARRRRR